MKLLFTNCLFSFLILLCTNSYSQEYGKVLEKKVADELFGLPKRRVEMNTESFKGILTKNNSRFMFKIIDNGISILNAKREIVFSPNAAAIEHSMAFKVFSLSKIEELLSLGMAEITYFEDRQNVFTITNGNYTLEFAGLCPPICDVE